VACVLLRPFLLVVGVVFVDGGECVEDDVAAVGLRWLVSRFVPVVGLVLVKLGGYLGLFDDYPFRGAFGQ